MAQKRKPQAPAEDSAAFGPIAERFRRAGELDRAVSLCREGLQKFPDHISARVTLGWALLDLGNFNEARVELELVLRRAPDNLSAIRGLAELHDRSEHTMDLPMDGPGQWPPNSETIERLDSALTSVTARAVANDDIVDEAVWVPAGEFSDQQDIDLALRHEQTDMAPIARAEDGGGVWSAATEVDPGTGVVSLSAFEEPAPSETMRIAADPIAALEVDLQALIAEADTLDAAADVASLGIEMEIDAVESAEPTLVLDAVVDLSVFEDATSELTAGFDAVADPEPLAGFIALDSLVAAAEPEGLTASAAPEALIASAEPVAIAAAIEVEPELVAAPAEEVTAVVDETPSFQLTPWDEAMAVQFDETGAEEVSAESPLDGLTLRFDFETVPAEVVSFVPVAAAAEVRSPLPGLERFLSQVQPRRLLMAESIA